MMDRDNTTRSGARAPGVERHVRSNGGVVLSHEPRLRARSIQAAGDTKDGCKLSDAIAAPQGKAPSDKPALEPYWGKPAVRHLREDDGNVGIIRSPVRAIVLPDRQPVAHKPYPDIPKVFGPGSAEDMERISSSQQATADFVGIAVHCAAGSPLCKRSEPLQDRRAA